MKSFRSHKNKISAGFTFPEVMIAAFIIGSLLTAIMVLQGSIMTRLSYYSTQMQRVFLLKSRLFEAAFNRARNEKDIAKEFLVDEPKTTIMYTAKKPDRESMLKRFDDIIIEKGVATWEDGGVKREETMITFLHKPEKKKQA